jgi:hypothetical protein
VNLDYHVAEHFFKGVCICPCRKCTTNSGLNHVKCICKACPDNLCGAKEGRTIR